MAGVILMAVGFLRLGTYIKFIPYPVTVGFTAGIAVIIFASQIKDLLGLTLAGKEPGALLPKLEALARAIDTINPAAVAISPLRRSAIIVGLKRLRPHWPGMLIAVVVAGLADWAFGLPVETIGTPLRRHSRACLPAPHLPRFRSTRLQAVLPDALSPSRCSAPSSRCCRPWSPTA